MKGNIKWFSHMKGIGFITGEDGKDYFVHYSALGGRRMEDRAEDGAAVEFTPTEGEKGPRAESVTFQEAAS